MSESSEAFFEGKRPWSKIKDKVLESYIVPYLAKVNTRGQRILLIDGYAGPGVFEDGSSGSPIIMCEKAEERARGNYNAIFINKERKHHNKLSSEIQRRGWSNSAGETWKFQLIKAYQARLAAYLPFARFCPVREGTGKQIKYFIVFASRHKDALVLMNDFMVNAYFAGMHTADFVGGLWEETDWREMRSTTELDQVILDTVTKYPGKSRKQIWFHIVDEHFMRYLESEYLRVVKRLLEANKISSPTFTSTKRWNKDSLLYPYQP